MKVRLQWAIPSEFRGIEPQHFVGVRDLAPDELVELSGADPDTILARICGLSLHAVSRLTTIDRANITAARAAQKRHA